MVLRQGQRRGTLGHRPPLRRGREERAGCSIPTTGSSSPLQRPECCGGWAVAVQPLRQFKLDPQSKPCVEVLPDATRRVRLVFSTAEIFGTELPTHQMAKSSRLWPPHSTDSEAIRLDPGGGPVWDPLWPVDVGRRQAGQRRRARHRHVRGLDFSIEIIESHIVREADGIAIISRNVHLSPEKREKVLSLSRSLVNARTAALNNTKSASEHIKDQIVQTLTEAGGRVDYVEMN